MVIERKWVVEDKIADKRNEKNLKMEKLSIMFENCDSFKDLNLKLIS